VLDIVERPEYYATIVQNMRRRLSVKHSCETRLRELIDIINS
jgi:hypothetical protein